MNTTSIATDDAHTFQPVIFGKYLLLEKIGSGGMAEIYRAKTFGPHGFEKEYAIKKILPNLGTDSEFVSMFIHEAKLTVSLQHSNIVQILDLGEIGQQCFIAMEYVFGKDLHDLLAQCANRKLRIPLKLALYIIMEALKGLDYAHQATDRKGKALNLVHCDVSPSNILLSYEGSVQIGDFGVARAATQTNAKIDTLKGKIGYMSPEQVSGNALDRRSDLFACGIVLFEMLALRRLFIGDNDLNVMLKIRDGDIQRQMRALSSHPRELQDIVARALARDPNERYQSAMEFHRDILNFCFTHRIKVNSSDLGRFLKQVFHEDYQRIQLNRQHDPHSPAQFPDLLSPEVARWRYREPNGNIIGPMSRDTLLSLLSNRRDPGSAVSADYGAWCHPDELPELALELEELELASALEAPPSENFAFSATVAHPSPTVLPSGTQRAAREPDMQGSLTELPFARLLEMLSAREVTGRLKVVSGDVEKSIHLDQGSPWYVASNKPDELLGNFLCDQGVITRQQLDDALARLSEFGGRLGDILISEGFIPSEELFHYLSLQVREKLLQVFSWSEGTFTYMNGKRAEGEAYPLGINTLEIILEGIRTRMTDDAIEAFFINRVSRPMRLLTSKNINLDGSMLTKAELNVVVALHEGATTERFLAEYADTQLFDRLTILRAVFVLYATGLVDFE